MSNCSVKRLSEMLALEVQSRYGIDGGEAVRTKIEELLADSTTPGQFEKFAQLIKNTNHSEEWQQIIEKITIHEAYFQRNQNILDSASSVIDSILKEKNSIRIWSIPCSTGEEAYDLAFIAAERLYNQIYGTATLNDQRLENLDLHNIYVYGTDISEICLRKAKLAQYPDLTMGSLRKLTPIKRRYFFNQVNELFEVKQFIKRIVKFVVANVLDQPIQNNFDIIMCRNMLIYFGDEQKKLCQKRLSDALVPGGYLFLGSVDPFLLDPKDFIQHSDGHSIWYQKKKD